MSLKLGHVLTFFCVCFFSHEAFSQKMIIQTGVFSFTAKEDDKDIGEVSGVGLYRLSYMYGIQHNIELGIGYTFLSSKVVTGDWAYGFEIHARYYPLQNNHSFKLKQDHKLVTFDPLLRPYIGAGVFQRQFQSTSATYGGPGLSVGTLLNLNRKFDFDLELKYLNLQGKGTNSASEVSLAGGITLEF